jgi:PEP-CTERM motif
MALKKILFGSAAIAAGLLGLSGQSNAQLSDAGTFKNLTNEQTGPTTVSPRDPFFNALADFTNPGDYSSASLTVNGGAPQDLPLTSPTGFGIGVGFPNQATMDAAFPFGTYVIALTAGTQPAISETLSYTADAYTSDTPRLDAASFNALLGLRTSLSSLTLNFNPFSPSGLATSAFTFFSIGGTSQGCGFLSPSATSCTIDPKALSPGTTFDWELDFSDRIETTVDGVLTGVDFDVRTDGSFTTAAATPEPSTWAMMLLGFVGIGYLGRRRMRVAALARGPIATP